MARKYYAVGVLSWFYALNEQWDKMCAILAFESMQARDAWLEKDETAEGFERKIKLSSADTWKRAPALVGEQMNTSHFNMPSDAQRLYGRGQRHLT